jgi:hypothetical protein
VGSAPRVNAAVARGWLHRTDIGTRKPAQAGERKGITSLGEVRAGRLDGRLHHITLRESGTMSEESFS